jgi:hypothetical protein
MENKIARSCWFLHKWTKWERYERPIFRIIEGVKYNAVQPHQRRKCIRWIW